MKFQLDPMEDPRLSQVPYEVWHYMVMLEWGTQNTMLGFSFKDDNAAYNKGYTPRRFITEAYASAVMTAIDNQPDFFKWMNNYAHRPAAFNEIVGNKKDCKASVGRDVEGWLLQIFFGGYCIGSMRFDKKAPAPPGWKEK